MNTHIVSIIIKREYLNRVKKKSFLVITFLGPILMAALCLLPSLIMFMANEKAQKVAVIDQSGIVMPYLTSNESISTSSNQINYSGSTSMRGKGNCSGNCYLSFASHFWWDDDTDRPYSWLINFSTEGISTSHLSMQLYVLNSQQTWYAPRYWKAEWSETDSQAPEDDDKWHLIGEYTVPDVSVWANTLYSSIVAYKPINFDLPLELLGKKDVYVRLSPANDICSDGSEYANTTIGAHANGALYAAHASNLSYFAIRYNK